jgi:hypothetical protein
MVAGGERPWIRRDRRRIVHGLRRQRISCPVSKTRGYVKNTLKWLVSKPTFHLYHPSVIQRPRSQVSRFSLDTPPLHAARNTLLKGKIRNKRRDLALNMTLFSIASLCRSQDKFIFISFTGKCAYCNQKKTKRKIMMD